MSETDSCNVITVSVHFHLYERTTGQAKLVNAGLDANRLSSDSQPLTRAGDRSPRIFHVREQLERPLGLTSIYECFV